jgi:hypothetical protein
MRLIVVIKRFLILINIITLITILSYLYAFNIRSNEVENENENFSPTHEPSLVKKPSSKNMIENKIRSSRKFTNVTNHYTTLLRNNISDSYNNLNLKLTTLDTWNSTQPSIEYYEEEGSTTASISTAITTTTTATSTITTTITTANISKRALHFLKHFIFVS